MQHAPRLGTIMGLHGRIGHNTVLVELITPLDQIAVVVFHPVGNAPLCLVSVAVFDAGFVTAAEVVVMDVCFMVSFS